MTTLAKAVLLAICLAVVPAYAQIAFRAAASATAAGITPAFRAANSATTTGATLSITKPAGTATGDVLVASIAVTPATVAITQPSGWTLVRRMDNSGPTSNSLAIYYKVATSGEPASYAWSVSGASFSVGGVQGFTGVDTANPIAVENGQSTPSATTHTAPAVTVTVANSMLVASHAFASSRTWTPPSGMTESFDRPSGSNNALGLSVEGSRVLLVVSGSTGTKIATAAGDADAGNAHLLALRPANANLSISTPSATASGDVMIAAIGFNNPGAAITSPSGWTLVRRMDNNAVTSNSLAVYRRTATAGEPSSHVWGVAGGAFVVGGIQSFSGVDTANPIDTESGQSTPSGTNHDTPNITTSTANTMLVTAHTYASSQSWTPQSGLTESFDRLSGSASATGQSITGTRQAQSVAGPTGTKRSTAASSADAGNTHILALRQATPNPPPVVSITSPSEGTTYTWPTTLTVTVAASDSNGSITSVFLSWHDQEVMETGSMELTQAPYSFVVPLQPSELGVEFNTYTFSATAFDNQGAFAFSNDVNVLVGPSITLTSPANGATFSPPATISLNATYSFSSANLARVEFYQGTTLIGQHVGSPPYTFAWQNVPAGNYSLTAKAISTFGWTRTSAPVSVTVGNLDPKLHFIHVDHLNTPRLIANEQGQTVWRWDQQEPFGINMPDENPSSLGAFEFPLRFPGQYADKESNLFYNYLRDYDPAIGRYIESDPIGLHGGLNTFLYVNASPIGSSDPLGLAAVPRMASCGPAGDPRDRVVPNNPLGYWFQPCCHTHDQCYDNCNGPSKQICDMDACDCFNRRCSGNTFNLTVCRLLADIYCRGVMYTEQSFEQFNKARKKCSNAVACRPEDKG